MIDNIIGKRYAEAIYELVESENLLAVYEDLENVVEIYTTNKNFNELMNHPKLNSEEKKKILQDTFSNKISEFSFEMLNYLLDKDRFSYLKSIADEYLIIYNERNNLMEVEATFAIEPSEEQKAKLEKNLEKTTGKKVKIDVKIDKSIIGGGILRIGDRIIDGSLKRQFEMLRANL
ncbi:ATP synthase F1 subunit delta [Haliovirga abyssi]|uniref:ATP synthase subunit delta n=1 Tax=Haliovirga abyssi TaxID=2996794 RepID=A0AAU9DCJ0_9FUSO|nr:ATP synthase F1 subunit delta [Haliovirga abyssi]BDU50012.1 ATP synthase subunit delta [Haliovirga abyssi]